MAKAAKQSKTASKCKYQTVMTGSDGKKLPPVICRDKADAENMKRNIESLGYKVEIQTVKPTKPKSTVRTEKTKRKTKSDTKPTAAELGAELEAKTNSLRACLHNIKSKPTTVKKPEKDKPVAPMKAATPTAAKPAPTFTVVAGRKSKTFATKAEAQAYGKQCKEKTGKKYAIRESKKKPSHKVVSFTAKRK